MPATSGIADISIAGKARSYDTRLSLFVVLSDASDTLNGIFITSKPLT